MLVTNSSLNEDVGCASKGVQASPDFESTICYKKLPIERTRLMSLSNY